MNLSRQLRVVLCLPFLFYMKKSSKSKICLVAKREIYHTYNILAAGYSSCQKVNKSGQAGHWRWKVKKNLGRGGAMFHDSRGRNQSSLALDKMKHLRQSWRNSAKKETKSRRRERTAGLPDLRSHMVCPVLVSHISTWPPSICIQLGQ